MKYHFLQYSWLVLALFVSENLYSAPIDDFYSDEFVGEASAKIGDMNKNELEYFINYLASCTVNTKSETQQFYCERDRAIFKIKYFKKNELKSLINTMLIIDLRINQLSDSRGGSNDRKEFTKLLFRSLEVNRKLKEAATIYYGVDNK